MKEQQAVIVQMDFDNGKWNERGLYEMNKLLSNGWRFVSATPFGGAGGGGGGGSATSFHVNTAFACLVFLEKSL